MKIVGIEILREKALLTIVNKGKFLSHLELKIPSLKKFLKGKNGNVGSAIDTKALLIKNILIDIKKRDIVKAFKFQKNVIASLESKESLIETIVGKEENKQRELFFYITKKSLLNDHLKTINEKGVFPDFTTSFFHAQVRFFTYFFNNINQAFLIHIGEKESSLVLMENSLPKEAYSLDIGSVDLEDNKHKFFNEIAKTFYSFLRKEKNKTLPVFFTGEKKLGKDFYEDFLKVNKPFVSEILKIKKIELLPYAISMGICLDFMSKDGKNLQFLKDDFASKKMIKKTRNFVLKTILISFLFASGMFFYGKKKIMEKEDVLNRNIVIFQKEENISLKNPTIEKLEKYINKESKYFPYFPVYHKVSFVLSYLSNHPLLKKAKIHKLDYKLTQYPIGKKHKKYKTKVFFEFSSEIIDAREFFESIQKENFIEEKTISWKEEKDRYRISFFIKNLNLKSIYE